MFEAGTAATFAAFAGFLVAIHTNFALGAAAAIVALTCPRWALLAGAIGSAVVVPTVQTLGVLQLPDLLVSAFLVRSVCRWAIGKDGEMSRLGASELWLLAFLVWAWIGLAAVGSESTATALLRVTLYATAAIAASQDPTLARPLLLFVLLLAIVQVVVGVINLSSLGDRLTGTYDDPHQTGIVMLAGLAAVVLLSKKWKVAVGSLLVAGLALTLTRGVWAASIAEVAVLLAPTLRQRLSRIGVTTALTLVVAVLLVPTVTQEFNLNPESIQQRRQSITTGLRQAADAPVFGVGWAVGRAADPSQPPAYNLWVNLAASTGIVGMVTFSLFLFELLRRLVRIRRPEPQAITVFLVGSLVMGASTMPIYAASPAAVILFLLAGAGSALTRTSQVPAELSRRSLQIVPQDTFRDAPAARRV